MNLPSSRKLYSDINTAIILDSPCLELDDQALIISY